MSSENPDTRTRILNATWSLLENGGGSSVRMSDIAKAANVSRQAVYLHFANRLELLMATTRYVDAVKDVDRRLIPSRAAQTGVERLDAYVLAWGSYIPEIYGVAHALIALGERDAEARAAWADRLVAIREGFAAAVEALDRDGRLTPEVDAETATDLLCGLVSVPMWEHLVQGQGWTQPAFVREMQRLARAAVVSADLQVKR